MTSKMGIAIAAFALAAASASSASAQTAPMMGERAPRGTVRAPANAFEVQANTGYTNGFGPQIGATRNTPSSGIGGSGMGVGLGLAYRANPRSSVGVVGSYSQQNGTAGSQLRGATAGLDATYHANPFQRLDPFLSIGTGYRMVWEQAAGDDQTLPDTFTHGFQLARAAVGVDVRLTDDIAIAPTIGGDVNMFLWRNAGRGNQTIDNPRVHAFLFAGVAGRFDMGGSRLQPPATLGQR
jgi:outer membrane protein W